MRVSMARCGRHRLITRPREPDKRSRADKRRHYALPFLSSLVVGPATMPEQSQQDTHNSKKKGAEARGADRNREREAKSKNRREKEKCVYIKKRGEEREKKKGSNLPYFFPSHLVSAATLRCPRRHPLRSGQSCSG